jgi:hypothetical protein
MSAVVVPCAMMSDEIFQVEEIYLQETIHLFHSWRLTLAVMLSSVAVD